MTGGGRDGAGIAVLSSKGSRLASGVPTLSEAGVRGLDVDCWLGLFGPATTPRGVIEKKLRSDVRAALPELRERFEKPVALVGNPGAAKPLIISLEPVAHGDRITPNEPAY